MFANYYNTKQQKKQNLFIKITFIFTAAALFISMFLN